MVIDELKLRVPARLLWVLLPTCLGLHFSSQTYANAASPVTPNLPTTNSSAGVADSPGSVISQESASSQKLAAAQPLPAVQGSDNTPSANNSNQGGLTPDVVYEQDDDSKQIAQAVAQAATSQQIDLAPVKLPERTTVNQLDEFRTSALYKLPARMFLAATCENSLRLETNVFQTSSRYRSDMIYRVLPNVTLGYALTRTTRVSSNYFFFRDQYTKNSNQLSRNIHSIGFRVDQDIPITRRTSATVSFFGRQLLLSRSQPLSDLLPSATIVRRVGDRGAVYASVLGQIRFRNTLGRFQEGDQFYSLGGVYRTPRWTFLADHTFITNFGKRQLRGGPNNQVFVLTYEAAYKLHPLIPMQAFVRTEPIFNIGANQAPGFAGVNVRVFGGLRFDVAKPPIFPVRIRRA